jgi:hypothetical protein
VIARISGVRTLATAGLGAALSLLAVAALAAPSFTVHSEVDANKVGVEDTVQLSITIEGSGGPDTVALPALTNLQVAGGPYSSTQVSIVNGRMSQSRTFTWVLQPRAVGKAEVGAVSAEGQTAPAIPIEVVAGSVKPAAPARQASPFGMEPFGTDPFEEMFGHRRARPRQGKVLVKAIASRTTLSVGEPLVLTYFLYTQVPVSDLQFKDAPQYAGFWVEDLERPRESPNGEAATVEGERYQRVAVMRKLLFPTKAGRLTLPAATFRIGLPAQGFFDEAQTVERATTPVAIEVRPLPDAPGFSGAVGQFHTSATLDRDTVPLGDAALLRFKVEGTGNLKWIDRPPAVQVEGARVYPPQVKNDLKVTPGGIEGSRTWEFVVVPETGGTLQVPAVEFSYFDPGAGRIQTAETHPLALHVEGGTVASRPGPAPPAAAAGGTLPLRADLDPPHLALPALAGRTVGLLAGLVLLLHVGLLGAGHVRGAVRRAGGRSAPARSVKAALRDLDRAGRQGLAKEEAAILVERALHEAFGEIGDDDPNERSRAVRDLLSEVHFVRYAPQLGDYSENLRDLVSRASATVKRWA